MSVEAVLLTGGKSRRMGRDKARLPVDGVPMAERIVEALSAEDIPVVVLGNEPVGGARFLPDREEHAGPLAALGAFRPRTDYVFVCSCDLPRFDARIVKLLVSKIGDADAAVPLVDGFRQPLCAVYGASAFERLPALIEEGSACAMRWLDALDVITVPEEAMTECGISPSAARGANTPEELKRVLSGA